MLRFVVRRMASAFFVMFSLSVLVFLIFFATPGSDPAARIAGRNADQQTLREVRKDFGLDRPMPVQYALMMKKLFVTRDLTSFVNRGAKVVPQVIDAAPITFSLVLGASVLWVTFAVALGLVAAVYRGRTLDAVVMIVGLIGISMPVFWLGEVVNWFTQSRLHHTFLFSWLPPPAYVPFSESPAGWFEALLLSTTLVALLLMVPSALVATIPAALLVKMLATPRV